MKNNVFNKIPIWILMLLLTVFISVGYATYNDGEYRQNGIFTVNGVIQELDTATDGTSLCFEGTTKDAFETCFLFTDPTADRTVTFGDASYTAGATNAHTSDVTITGTTPTLTIGDGGAEDAGVIFNGIADYYFGADDTGGLAEDVVCVGVGGAIGTTPTMCFNATQQMILENGETIDNVTDDTILLTSGDENLTVNIQGATGNKSSILILEADAGADAADTWTHTVADGGAYSLANGGTATLTIGEAVTVSGALTASAAATVGTTLGVTGISTLAGITQPIVLVTDAATYTVLAANTGKVHLIADLSQATDIDLPASGGTAGDHYRFVYIGGADDAADHTIDALNDTNFFIGGVSFSDTDAGDAADEINAGIYSDGGSNSKLTIDNISAGTVVDVYSNGTNWYVSGRVFADTAPAFADQ